MTLRARLTGAFLAVVLGPVVIGSAFVAVTVSGVNDGRARERLDTATTALRTALSATCDRMRAVAEAAAALTLGGTSPAAADQLVAQGAAGAIKVETSTGTVATPGAPAGPWAMCAPVAGAPPPGAGTDFQALAAGVQIRDAAGRPVGYVYAAQPLDVPYLRQIAGGAGADVTLPFDPSRSTSPGGGAARIARAADDLTPTGVGEADGAYLRLVRVPDARLALVVSVPATVSHGLILVVIGVVLFCALAAIGAARVLARSTARPLAEIAEAADRVAGGDLEARVPVRHDDEVGQLAAAFNRMTREMRRYVDALVASRDQIRGNLERLGDMLSSTHDLPRILRVILESAVNASGAGAGLVLLTEENGELRFHCGEGFDQPTTELLRTLTVAPGNGLLGTVAATGTARRGRIAAAGRGPLLATGEPVCRTYLAVPLRVPARRGADGSNRRAAVHGVLALYDRVGDDDFDDTDLRAVLTFAGHAAVAVENVRLHEEARRLSLTDALTGLYNYRHLTELLRREIHRAARFGHPLCAVTLDLDRFKEVNDVYGHAAGDAVLVEFARRIGHEIRGVDFAFRSGGEEFVLLLPETDALGGVTLARRLRTVVRGAKFPVRSRQGPEATVGIRVTASIGVAVYPEHGTTGAQVLQAADDALYAAKAAGRDTYRLAPRPRRTAATLPGAVPSGASGGTHPPRQSRGR